MRPADSALPGNPVINEQPLAQTEAWLAQTIKEEMYRELYANRPGPGAQEYQVLKAAMVARVVENVRARHAATARPSLPGQERFICFVAGVMLVFALPVVGHALAGAAGRAGGRLVERKMGLEDESR